MKRVMYYYLFENNNFLPGGMFSMNDNNYSWISFMTVQTAINNITNEMNVTGAKFLKVVNKSNGMWLKQKGTFGIPLDKKSTFIASCKLISEFYKYYVHYCSQYVPAFKIISYDMKNVYLTTEGSYILRDHMFTPLDLYFSIFKQEEDKELYEKLKKITEDLISDKNNCFNSSVYHKVFLELV